MLHAAKRTRPMQFQRTFFEHEIQIGKAHTVTSSTAGKHLNSLFTAGGMGKCATLSTSDYVRMQRREAVWTHLGKDVESERSSVFPRIVLGISSSSFRQISKGTTTNWKKASSSEAIKTLRPIPSTLLLAPRLTRRNMSRMVVKAKGSIARLLAKEFTSR